MRASNSLARTCSGDIYATVPSVAPGLVRCCTSAVSVCVSAAAFWLAELADGATLASPKSRILACPRLVTKMFAGLMSRWTMPLAVGGLEPICNVDAERQQTAGLQWTSCDAVFQRHPFQELHHDERLAFVLRRFRGWCRYWDGSGLMPPAPLGGSVPVLAGLLQRLQAGTSGRRSGPVRCPRPCRPRPCRRHPASQRCGSGRWFGRSCASMLWRKHRQVNESGSCGIRRIVG